MNRETYRLVDNIHPLYIIDYIFFFLHPCIQLPTISTQSLSLFHASAYDSTSLSYISLILFLFHHFSHNILFISSYSSISSFRYHTAPLHLSLSSSYKVHSNNTCISVSTSTQPHLQSSYFNVSFHFLLRANILFLPSVVLLHQHLHLQNLHFLDFLSFVHTLSPFLCH